jgi:hypothetical protein
MCIWSENSSAKTQSVVERFGWENEMIVERFGWDNEIIGGAIWVGKQNDWWSEVGGKARRLME